MWTEAWVDNQWIPFDSTILPESPATTRIKVCLLYTSDAADERSSVDLGGRRIIKKKNVRKTQENNEVLKKHERLRNV